MDPQQLRATIASARAGSEEAYRQLLAAYGARLYGYFCRATRSHHDAEDLLGELMLRLVRRLGAYEHRDRFEPWLFSIAANLVRDRIRRAKVSPAAMSLEAERAGGTNLGESLGEPGRPVDADLLAQDASDRLAGALERLDERSRQMVLLRHFGQMSFKEIADIFQCPVGTVLAKVHRALKSLRAILEHEDDAQA
jgi:RNA polymerase sigma-70 factor (ECF subfamily)